MSDRKSWRGRSLVFYGGLVGALVALSACATSVTGALGPTGRYGGAAEGVVGGPAVSRAAGDGAALVGAPAQAPSVASREGAARPQASAALAAAGERAPARSPTALGAAALAQAAPSPSAGGACGDGLGGKGSAERGAAKKGSAERTAAQKGVCASPLQSAEAWAAANKAARQVARPDRFEAARAVFHYEPGALYEIVTHPNFVTTILLEAGETLLDIAAGDTARWMVTEAVSSSESDPRTVVLVKPRMEGLRTNIVLITNRRVYMVEALSQSRPLYAAQIAWSYPATDKPAGLGASRFSYRILPVRGRLPDWAPERVFDDGRAVHVVFPPEARGELAPLFVMTRDGPALANYRVIEAQGRTHYVVDGLFEAAELRLGVRKPLAVRIERIAGRSQDELRESAR